MTPRQKYGPTHRYGIRTTKPRRDPRAIVAALSTRELALRGGRATGGGSMRYETDFSNLTFGGTYT
jgi:hypothetical protein